MNQNIINNNAETIDNAFMKKFNSNNADDRCKLNLIYLAFTPIINNNSNTFNRNYFMNQIPNLNFNNNLNNIQMNIQMNINNHINFNNNNINNIANNNPFNSCDMNKKSSSLKNEFNTNSNSNLNQSFNNINGFNNTKTNSMNAAMQPINYNTLLEASNVSNASNIIGLSNSDFNPFNATLDSKSSNSLSEKRKLKKPRDEMDKTQFVINLEDVYYIIILQVVSNKDRRTTIMIRHIPNKYNTQSLLDEVNGQFKGKFDFFYLPMDNDCNLGYAFINFVEPLYILYFYHNFKGRKWRKYKSHKVNINIYNIS